MVVVSAYMIGTRGSGVLFTACDVQEMSVVRGVGRMCDMCMCLARDGVGGVGGSGWSAWARIWEGGVVLCLCVLSV